MRSLVVLHGPPGCNSGIQAFHLANGLAADGWDVVVAVPYGAEDGRQPGSSSIDCITWAEAPARFRGDPRKGLVVHAWTPREGVRRLTEEIVADTGAPYVVHLEDNEEHLAAVHTKLPYAVLRSLPRRLQDVLAREWSIHPARYTPFLSGAAGLTMVTESLNEFNSARRPYAIVPPVVDATEFAPGEGGAERRHELGIRSDEFVLVYHGNVHPANRSDIRSLYRAVELLRRRGRPVRLVKLGCSDRHSRWMLRALRAHIIELGVKPRSELVEYLRMADAFVQPGSRDRFNEYRFPSKVPEFLALARPVVLPECNVGCELEDGVDALLLRDGTAEEIATQVERLLADRELARRIGENGREFAVRRLTPAANIAAVSELLRRVLGSQHDLAPGDDSAEVARVPRGAPA